MKISIITPCFNAEETIEQTIISIIRSKTLNTELIVVDGGSTDNTLKILNRYKNDIDILVSEKDKGMYDAINKGINLSSGDVLGWLNADDLYFPWTLKTIEKIFNEFEEVKWLTGLPGFINSDGLYTGVRSSASAYIQMLIAKGWYQNGLLGHIQQESTFWRKELYSLSNGLDLNLKYAADYKLWTTFAKQAELYQLNIPIAAFRKGKGDQLSIKFKDIYEKEVSSVQKLNPIIRVIKKLNEKSLVLNAIFQLFIFGRSNIIGYSQPSRKWKIVKLWQNSSNNSFTDLRLAYRLYRK